MTADPPAPPRHSRLWLFAPFLLLALAAAGWTGLWFVLSERTGRALDAWLANEAALGRLWACPGRTIGGFPFRIEVSCAALDLQRPESRLSLGPVRAVAQVYAPRHVIARIDGPLRASDGHIGVEGTWRGLEASVRTTPDGLQRASVTMTAPEFRLSGAVTGDMALSARHFEMHLRPNPARSADGAYDWSLQAAQLALPGLDALIGGGERADLDLDLTVTQARDAAARSPAQELDRWRAAGGRLEIARFALAKGARRLEGKGEFGLDDAHRLHGRAELAAAGLEGMLGAVLGSRAGLTGALLGMLRGRPPEPAPPEARGGAGSGLKSLPPLRIEGGRVQLGPVTIPGLRLAPLY